MIVLRKKEVKIRFDFLCKLEQFLNVALSENKKYYEESKFW